MITKSRRIMIEVVGLALLLAAFIAQFHFVDYYAGLVSDIRLSSLSYKVDQIHYRQYQIGQHMDFKAAEIEEGSRESYPYP